MITTDISTLKINKLTQEQYDRELAAGTLNENEIYLTPEVEYLEKNNPTGTGSLSLNRKADTTIGSYSVAEGYNATASGYASHAEGGYTTASGYWSHAEGSHTTASGSGAHAEGGSGGDNKGSGGSHAAGTNSHAEGSRTYAMSEASHAEGIGTKAYGMGSHAEGTGHVSNDKGSVYESSRTVKSESTKSTTITSSGTWGIGAHAEGGLTWAYSPLSHTEGSSTTAYGVASHAEGSNTRTNAEAAHAEGYYTIAHEKYSHAEGTNTFARGVISHAEGAYTISPGQYSHAEGYYTVAQGRGAHAEGNGSINTNMSITSDVVVNDDGTYTYKVTNFSASALLPGSFVSTSSNLLTYIDNPSNQGVETYDNFAYIVSADVWESTVTVSKALFLPLGGSSGDITSRILYVRLGPTAYGEGSHAEGAKTVAFGNYSHAEGSQAKADGEASHAEGYNTTASGQNSHAEGSDNTALGYSAHAEGTSTKASERGSHAEGGGTTASGMFSHAEGSITTASEYASHAEGYYTTAASKYQHVQGKYNISDENNTYAHIVGNGTAEDERSNAHTLDWSGNAWFAGNLTTGGKTTAADGLPGCFLDTNGILCLQGSGANPNQIHPQIRFFETGVTDAAYNGRIYSSSGNMYFERAQGYFFDKQVTTEGSVLSKYSFYSGNKTGVSDGKTGIVVGDNGNLYITASEPSIRFYSSNETSETGRIWCDGNMNFTNTISTNGSLQMGTGDTSAAKTIALGTYWKDKAYHYLIQRYDNGLTAAFGWAGSSSYASVTVIRGQSCKLGSASGTTITSDERLKKDFTSLEEWDKFFDAIEPCAFRLKNGNGGRFHMGFKAQQIEQALLDSGKTTQDFAGFVKSAYTFDEDDDPHNIAAYEEAGIKDGEDEYGLIYTEFTALNTYQIQKLKAENVELKSKLASQEERLRKLEQMLEI